MFLAVTSISYLSYFNLQTALQKNINSSDGQFKKLETVLSNKSKENESKIIQSTVQKVIQKTNNIVNPVVNFLTNRANCASDDNHAQGILTSKFNDNGKLIGWNCSMGGHMNCTAGPDGIWKECTFPPDVMVWPNPVDKKALDDPKAYAQPVT
jgi:hypothetical protein